MTIFTHLFFWPRYIIGWSFFFTACAANFIILLGTDAKKIPMWKIELGRLFIKYCSWGIQLSMGLYSQKKRLYTDYSKWLGPDQNQNVTYDGAGINVCNHIGFFDMTLMLALMEPMSGFIAKAESQQVGPGV